MNISTHTITLKQHKSLIRKNIIDKTDRLLLILPPLKKDARQSPAWPDFPYTELLQKRWKDRTASDKAPALLVTDLPNSCATRVFLTTASTDSSPYDTLKQAREIIAAALADNPASLVLAMTAELDEEQKKQFAEALISATLAATHTLPSFRKKEPAARKLNSIHIYGCKKNLDSGRLQAEADGNNLARSLTALPPNKLAPRDYLKQIRILARTQGWKLEFLDHKALLGKKAGAFLAVSQGSDHKDAGIVHLTYTPPGKVGKARRRLALVGKGICFDTGGNNLKPARYMHGMHEDMQGSAVALGTLLTLTRLQVPFAIDCWLALAENHIGPRAYKQNDIFTACNGLSIEVIHTDAEGRMVLADTLALAARGKPDLIIDYATLTGTCIHALGTRYSGVFSNRDALHDILINAGRDSGERVWPFPMDEDYDAALESQVADVKQCSLDGEADHILAARFLQRFVDDCCWIHIDLSSGNNKGGLAHIPSDITGFGVRYTVNLLLDNGVWGAIT